MYHLKAFNFQYSEENAGEDADEALSLRGLVLNSDDTDTITEEHPSSPDSRSSSEQIEFFEFFNDGSSEMSHAEDIIFRGKLVPFKERSHSDHLVYKRDPESDETLLGFQKRRSESMSELKSNRGDSSKSNMMRSSKSLDYEKLYGNRKSSMRFEKSQMERNSSTKTSGKNDPKLAAKPRWYVFLFGPGKFPSEMALHDIKSRQERRCPATLFATSLNASEKELLDGPDDRRSSSSSSWDLLRVLSCKNDASVAVTTSFGCLQHV